MGRHNPPANKPAADVVAASELIILRYINDLPAPQMRPDRLPRRAEIALPGTLSLPGAGGITTKAQTVIFMFAI
jgi:hypothetical protein